ncbi:MAG: ribonuclease [Lachnospiraceae bacterium]|nr:ribonuclease [Lachnospiraceae bacterium]
MKKKIFRIFATLLVFMLLVCGIVACKNDNPEDPVQTTQEITTAEETTTSAATEAETQKESQKETKQEKETKKEKETKEQKTEPETKASGVREDGEYTSKEEVAEYIYLYGHLPSNYITKDEAEDLGWKSKGNLDKVAPGKSIGGDKFGNREGILPTAKGRKYYECDIDYKKGSRNAKRIVFSNDGLVYYTEDHYETFELLYGEE